MKIAKNSISLYQSSNNFKFLLFVLFLLLSCRNTDNMISNGTAVVRINLSGSVFDNSGRLGSNASLKNSISYNDNIVQKEIRSFNDQFVMVAELSPVDAYTKITMISSNDIPAVQNGQKELKSGVRYKVMVYNINGDYITERNYTRGQEANAEVIELNEGETYTFIAYSLNSERNLPEVSFADASAKKLSESHLEGISGDSDFMYFRRDMRLSGDQVNYLDIVLKHKFSQIISTFDASLTGYNITNLDAGIDSHYPEAQIQLSDGAIIRNGTVGNTDLNFSNLNQMIVTGDPLILNGNTTTGSLVISDITIGNVTKKNLIALRNMTIIPGVKYNLKLSLRPNDSVIIHRGIPSMEIEGMIWMQHDLGADISISTDQDIFVKGHHGNLYQWGSSVAVANIDTAPEIIAGWSEIGVSDDKQWNGGTEDKPVKTVSDPCPVGFRIPTNSEYRRLINATNQVNSGIWLDQNDNYGAARVLYSKTNKNVRLVFPMSGRRALEDGELHGRGTFGAYWASSSGGANVQIWGGGRGLLNYAFFRTSTSFGQSIRCVGE